MCHQANHTVVSHGRRNIRTIEGAQCRMSVAWYKGTVYLQALKDVKPNYWGGGGGGGGVNVPLVPPWFLRLCISDTTATNNLTTCTLIFSIKVYVAIPSENKPLLQVA